MEYINETVLNNVILRKEAFKNNIQFPWMNIKDFIYYDKFKLLFDNFVPYEIFGGEKNHKHKLIHHLVEDVLEKIGKYPYWGDLLKEFQSNIYKEFLNDMFEEKVKYLEFEFFIHERGSYLPPHCDSTRKIGSHLFYLLPSDYWNPEWGGQTEILLTDKKESNEFKSHEVSRDQFEEKSIKPKIVDNHSLLFKKTNKSWHFVDTVDCPPDKRRIMFQLIALRSR